MAFERKIIGSLEALVVPGRTNKTVVTCHGYGADANDLAPLCEYLDRHRDYTWVFPEAPLKVPIGMGMWGRAWFPIDMLELDRVSQQRDYDFWLKTRPDGLNEANTKFYSFLQKLDCDPSHLIIGGFSQGSMVAIDTILGQQLKCAGIAILSGTLLDSKKWQELGPSLRGTPYFQSHGQYDPILPYALAERLDGMLQSWGWQGKTHFFSGGHEIPVGVLMDLSEFIKSCFAEKA